MFSIWNESVIQVKMVFDFRKSLVKQIKAVPISVSSTVSHTDFVFVFHLGCCIHTLWMVFNIGFIIHLLCVYVPLNSRNKKADETDAIIRRPPTSCSDLNNYFGHTLNGIYFVKKNNISYNFKIHVVFCDFQPTGGAPKHTSPSGIEHQKLHNFPCSSRNGV